MIGTNPNVIPSYELEDEESESIPHDSVKHTANNIFYYKWNIWKCSEILEKIPNAAISLHLIELLVLNLIINKSSC